ncbi:MAG: hypothetical protein U0232_06900 [Thermomicrobiales bacterium]
MPAPCSTPKPAKTPPVDRLIVVGGTAQTSWSCCCPNEARTLTPRRLAGAVAILTGATVADSRNAATGLDPERVRTLPPEWRSSGRCSGPAASTPTRSPTGGPREGLMLDHIRCTTSPAT